MSVEIEIRAELSAYRQTVDLYIRDRTTMAFAKNVIFERTEEGLYVEPSLRLSETNAQLLIDELWRCGLRPTEGTGSAGALAATQAHLQDMRRLVFDGRGDGSR